MAPIRPVRIALCAALLFGWGVLFAQGGFGGGQQGAQQGGFRGVQRGFGARQNEAGGQQRQQGARQGGFGGQQGGQRPAGMPGGFGGGQGGFGGFPPGAGAAVRTETKLKRPFGAGQYDTSAFMAGEIHVNLVLFECNGKIDAKSETWSKDEIAKVVAHVKNACAWWEEMWKRKNYIGELHFTVDLDPNVVRCRAWC